MENTALDRAHAHALTWLASLDERRVPSTATATVAEVVASASFGSDDATRAVVQGMLSDGTSWTTGSRWHDRAVLRVSVSNWSTSEADVTRTLTALRAVAGGLGR